MKDGRLRFIDMARSIAILMMLEGHFVDLTLKDSARQPGWLPYDIWLYLRGITAPVFFMVTGLVFSFLLCRHAGEAGFFRLARVRGGILRSCELFFWGYLIQLNLRRIPAYLDGDIGPRAFTFHTLQCVGSGLLVMIAIFGLHRLVRRGPIWLWFAGAGLFFYLGGVALTSVPKEIGFPQGAPLFVRNAFHSEHSVFTVFPWLGFVMYGATVGALIRRYLPFAKKPLFPIAILATGFLLRVFGGWIDHAMAAGVGQVMRTGAVEPLVWFHHRAGEALLFLGLLMAWENTLGMRDSRLLTVGRNTFPIYVIHVMVLYGGGFGIGLSLLFKHQLDFGTALLGALAFLLFFVMLAQFIAPLNTRWRSFKRWLVRPGSRRDPAAP